VIVETPQLGYASYLFFQARQHGRIPSDLLRGHSGRDSPKSR
jgi:hypothetical protein